MTDEDYQDNPFAHLLFHFDVDPLAPTFKISSGVLWVTSYDTLICIMTFDAVMHPATRVLYERYLDYLVDNIVSGYRKEKKAVYMVDTLVDQSENALLIGQYLNDYSHRWKKGTIALFSNCLMCRGPLHLNDGQSIPEGACREEYAEQNKHIEQDGDITCLFRRRVNI